MSKRNNLLFFEGDLFDTLDSYLKKIPSIVDNIPINQLLATPEDDLIRFVLNNIDIDPIVIYEESAEMENHEIQIDVSGYRNRNIFREPGPIYVSGIRIVVSIPYTGNPMLLKMKPNKWQTIFPHGEIRRQNHEGVGYLDIVIEQPTDEPQDQIKHRLESELKSIRFYLESQKIQVEQFNISAPDRIKQAIQSRKNRLKTHEGMVDMLGIPLKRRDGAPPVQIIPIKRKLVRPLPPTPKTDFHPEPGISDEDYNHILNVIRHVGRTFEVTPKTYNLHDEEELRDIMLAHLNGHYQGSATGETFRKSGKTDIRIEDHERAAFVAECKVWRGAKEMTSAVDQLTSYLTWRDCKAAIVIFNKHNAKFTELIDKIPEVFRTHPQFKKELGQKRNGEWGFIFTSKEDELRQIILKVFVFNLYVA